MNNEAVDNTQPSPDDAGSKQAARILQFVRAGAAQFGIFADEIATIIAWREPTPLPQAPKSVLGVVSVQGRMLTVLDLAALLVGETASSDAPGKAPEQVVALRGDEQLALAVDEVGETIEIANGELEAKRETTGTLVLGVLQRDGAEIKILNTKELFSSAIQGRERRRRRF